MKHRIAVLYYSSTGNVHDLATAVAAGAAAAGAEIRVRRVAELAPPEAIDRNPEWHWGAIIVPPSYTDPAVERAGGNPYGTSHASADGAPTPEVLAAPRFQGRRLATVTEALVQARTAPKAA